MWLKDYGIKLGETIKIRVTKIYRNKNGKLVANAITQTDNQKIQFNIKEAYASYAPGMYNLTCNNKGPNGFPYVELNDDEATLIYLDELQETPTSHWSDCNQYLENEINKTKQEISELNSKLKCLEHISKEWKRK